MPGDVPHRTVRACRRAVRIVLRPHRASSHLWRDQYHLHVQGAPLTETGASNWRDSLSSTPSARPGLSAGPFLWESRRTRGVVPSGVSCIYRYQLFLSRHMLGTTGGTTMESLWTNTGRKSTPELAEVRGGFPDQCRRTHLKGAFLGDGHHTPLTSDDGPWTAAVAAKWRTLSQLS